VTIVGKIGIVDLDSDGWTAGRTYSVVAAKSLARAAATSAAEVGLYFISQSENVPGTNRILRPDVVPLPFERLAGTALGRGARQKSLPGEAKIRRTLRLSDPADPVWLSESHGLDAVFPVISAPRKQRGRGPGTVGWIPDFQHVELPGLFTAHEIHNRNKANALLAQRCDLVVLSSESVSAEFTTLHPAQASKARVLRFPSRFAFAEPTSNPDEVLRKFNLPDRYMLCANQFWAHKNHVLLVEALGILRRKGLRINVVLTGLPLDYRSTTNQPTSTVLQAIATNGLQDQISVLGLVPGRDLEGLLRGAVAVIQPSKHEGWSTTVQDAKALGRPLLCSNIPVHREQVPGARFFDLSADDLAAGLADVWEQETSPDDLAEPEALSQERAFALAHGQHLLALCQEVGA
jgi:glycosyltransferase involved in cell wall biosynthesis